MIRSASVLLLIMVASLLCAKIAMSAQKATSGWTPFECLLGDWVGEGGGQPGQGTGGFSFHPDLQGRILVRKSYAAYPPTKGRPAYRHDDLMVIFSEPGSSLSRAIYLDNEGHVIRYSVSASPDRNSIEFVSEVSPSSPTFRLTYVKTSNDTLSMKFEVAPPGKPHSFSTYVAGKARRK